MSGCTLKLLISLPPLLVHEELVVNYCIITGLLFGFLQKFMQWALLFLQLRP